MSQDKDISQSIELMPLKFLDNMNSDKHMILFDENPEYSKIIQFHFLKKGLEKGEHGIYAMPAEEESIEREMSEYGIDVDRYKKENILDIYRTTHISESTQGNVFDNLLSRILPSDSTKPCRIVGMLDFNMKTKAGMENFLQSEKKSHSVFDSFRGSWICPYYVPDIEPENRLKWIRELITCHDSVIFTSSEDEGISFDTKHE